MRYYRRLLNISYKDHATNEDVRRKTQTAIAKYDKLPTSVKKQRLGWFGDVSRSSSLAKAVLQAIMTGKRRRGRQKKSWEDNVQEWARSGFGSSTMANEDMTRWKGNVSCGAHTISQGTGID